MKSKCIILLTIILIFYSCAKQVSYEDRIKQTFKFESVFTLEYDNPKDSYTQDAFGTIEFNKNTVVINLNIDGQLESEESTIRKVTIDDDSTATFTTLRYITEKGDITVFIKNDSVSDVTFFTKSSAITFLKNKKSKND